MNTMRIGSLFTGFGGLDLAVAQVLPVEHAWVADNDPAAVRVLGHHWPDVPNLGDITRVDWASVEPVDVLTGGFPCQDISNAGRREGISGARSGLWSCYVDAIRVLRPRHVFVENVASLVVRGLDTVLADLAALGFDAEWTVVPASGVGAPHRRERLFLAAADPASEPGQQRGIATPVQTRSGWTLDPTAGRGRTPVADTESLRRETGRLAVGDPTERSVAHRDRLPAAADATRDGRHQRWPEHAGQLGRPDAAQRGATTADPDGDGREGQPQPDREPHHDGASLGQDADRRVLDWGRYEPAIRQWERILRRAAPIPTIRGARSGRVLNPALAEWMIGLPDGWITGVPGLSRNDMLKLAGNGVVPQQAAAAYRWLLPLLEAEGVAA